MNRGQGRRLVDLGFRGIEALLVAILAAMLVLVFGNVVLRYGFNSGIIVSEEASRVLFVWLTFLGAVPVMRQHGHLGVEMVVGTLRAAGRRVCRAVCDLMIVGCCVVFGWGAWEQTILNATNYAPVSGIPTGWTYAAGMVSAIGIGALALADLAVTALGDPGESLVAHGLEP
ncbi:TRAP transporter small permease [uncultured Enterovirga sp.]|uniref:TRAP transporter small permease n=1 Tax=uncultured Enterovirga sp. TaxID=2026352 RepID=UPI0035CAF2D4